MTPNDPETPPSSGQSERVSPATRLDILISSNLLPGEAPEKFADLFRDFEDAFQPRTAMERRLLDDILCSVWRKYRLSILETYLIRWQMEMQAEMNRGQTDYANSIHAFRHLADNSRALQLIAANQSRNRHDIHQASRLLLDLRARLPRRRSTPVAQNEN